MLRIVFAFLSPIWLAAAPFIERLISWHATQINGAQYFDHVGIRPYITALYLLVALAVVEGALLIAAAASPKLPRKLPFVGALAFFALSALTFLPVLTNGAIGVLHTRGQPFNMRTEIFAITALPIFTMIALLSQAFPQGPKRSE